MLQALTMKLKKLVSYQRVGGLHFVKLGRFGASFYVRAAAKAQQPAQRELFN
jgi:hypothetical protein